MKNILKKRLERLMAKKTDLSSRAMASEDAAEIRSIGEQLKEINEEIKDINDEITALEAKEDEEKRSAQPVEVPASAVPVNGDIRGAFGIANPTEKRRQTRIRLLRQNTEALSCVTFREAKRSQLISSRALMNTDLHFQLSREQMFQQQQLIQAQQFLSQL